MSKSFCGGSWTISSPEARRTPIVAPGNREPTGIPTHVRFRWAVTAKTAAAFPKTKPSFARDGPEQARRRRRFFVTPLFSLELLLSKSYNLLFLISGPGRTRCFFGDSVPPTGEGCVRPVFGKPHPAYPNSRSDRESPESDSPLTRNEYRDKYLMPRTTAAKAGNSPAAYLSPWKDPGALP